MASNTCFAECFSRPFNACRAGQGLGHELHLIGSAGSEAGQDGERVAVIYTYLPLSSLPASRSQHQIQQLIRSLLELALGQVLAQQVGLEGLDPTFSRVALVE